VGGGRRTRARREGRREMRLLNIFFSYDTLVTKVAQYSAKLLKKPDQGRAVATVSHLFWITGTGREYKDGKRVLECLQRSLKIAGLSMDATTNVNLFVEILNEYLYYFDNKNTEVQT
jgi:vacuolar protein sorting-associated protein 35